MSRNLTPVPEEVRAAIRRTNYAYLFDVKEALYIPTTSERRFEVHRDCIGRTTNLPEGTMVWAFEHKKIGYSETVLRLDWTVPAPGADILYFGSDWTLVTLVEGVPHIAYVSGPKHNPPKVVGKVEG